MNHLRQQFARIPPFLWLALAALLLAFVLRFFALDQFPPGVQHDEVFVSNFAQTIVQGQYPIFFELNRGNEPLFMYLVAAMFKLFGENVWALRATAALCGLSALVLTFLLAHEMFGTNLSDSPIRAAQKSSGDFIALITVVGITVSFWALYESRIGLHAISTYLLAAATFYTFWMGWTRGNRLLLLLSGLWAGLATYTYRSGIFVPVALFFFVLYTLIFHRNVWGKYLWVAPVIFLIAALVYAPLFSYIATHPDTALARLSDLSGDMDALRQGNPLPMLSNAVRVFGMFGVSGDPEWRYNVALRPIFDPLWAILFYLGVLLAIWRFKRPAYAFALTWLVVMLMPSILSGSDLSQHRAVGAIGAAFIMPALALDEIRVWVSQRWGRAGRIAVGVLVAALVLFAAVGGIHAYFITWTNNPQVRLIQRADLAIAARWLDEHQENQRALVSAEFANDLDRGSFNLEARTPNRAQFFQGSDTFVLPARTRAFIVDTRSGAINDAFKREFLNAAPVYESKLADGTTEVAIYALTEDEFQILRTARGLNTTAQTQDGQIQIRDFVIPDSAKSGESVRGELWWQIQQPQVTDADNLSWTVRLRDAKNYDWIEATSMGYTPSQWQPNDLIISAFNFQLPVDIPPALALYPYITLTTRAGEVPLSSSSVASNTSGIALGTVGVEQGALPQDKPDLPVRYPSKAKFGDLQLLGSDAVGEAAAGGAWRLVLFWHANDQLPSDYKLRIVATTQDGQEISRSEETLLDSLYPTSAWRSGEYERTIHDLSIPADAPHGKAVVRVSLWTPDGKPVGRADGAPIAGIEIVGRARNFDKPIPQTPQLAHFGDAMEMVGYDLDKTELYPGQPLNLKLYWHALQPADKSYTVFVHLLDANGKVIGQKDAPPLQGDAPTNSWQKDEYLADMYSFDVASNAPSGAASLEIGFYDPTTGERLSVTDANGQPLGDHLLIKGLMIR